MLSLNPCVGVKWPASYAAHSRPCILYALRVQCMSDLHSPNSQTSHQPNERPWVKKKIQTVPSKNLKFGMEDILARQITIT